MPFPWEGQSVVWKKSGCAFLNQGNPLSLKWTETPIRVAFPKVGYVTGQVLEKKTHVLLDRWIVLHLFMFICSMWCGPCFTSKDRFGELTTWKSSRRYHHCLILFAINQIWVTSTGTWLNILLGQSTPYLTPAVDSPLPAFYDML